MRSIFYHIRRWAEQQKPGTVAYIALQKRQYEEKLLNSGYSRKQAKTLSGRRFRVEN